jgi:hypothetical protein
MRELMIAGLALAVASPALADTRSLSGFDNVNASGQFSVEVLVGPEYGVTVNGSDAARIRTRVDGDTLRIEPVNRPWFGNPRYEATIRVTLPRLEGVAASRGATLRASAGGECSSFEAAAAMGSDMWVGGLQCGAVEAAAGMGATLTLEGACRDFEAAAAMGAVVRAANLHCETADVSAAMGGEIAAYASVSYDASAAMGGDITVSGGAANSDRSAAMGGSITQRD